MFHKEFYPTPDHVLQMMNIDCGDKVILEPSAGKGNIVDYLKANGAKQVLACEVNKDLAEIVKRKCRFMEYDFFKLTAESISHIDAIVMNPPFSNGDDHLLHAWQIAPDGCEIYCLLNANTVKNSWSRGRRELLQVVEDYGSYIVLENAFSDAERQTDVEVAFVKLFKPRKGENEFEGFFMEEDEQPEVGNGIIKANVIREVVQRYVGAVKLYEKFEVVNADMNSLVSPFGLGGFTYSIGYKNEVSDKETFKKEVQKKAWAHIFSLMNINRFVTSGVMKDINKFVETQQKVPFTMRNIYKMLEIIGGTREHNFDRSLAEAVDNFTMHTHENRYNVEGWKTNSGYMLNKKFIVNGCIENMFGSNLSIKWGRYVFSDWYSI